MSITLALWSTGITMVVIGISCVTDLRSRRIPNVVTFPAIAIGLASHAVAGGWGGALVALLGALLAPLVLLILHAGKGPGGGDLKLAAVLGANLGPQLGIFAILASAIAGGVLAMIWALVLFLGSRSFRRRSGDADKRDPAEGAEEPDEPGLRISLSSIPYGVALSAGTSASLWLYWMRGCKPWPF